MRKKAGLLTSIFMLVILSAQIITTLIPAKVTATPAALSGTDDQKITIATALVTDCNSTKQYINVFDSKSSKKLSRQDVQNGLNWEVGIVGNDVEPDNGIVSCEHMIRSIFNWMEPSLNIQTDDDTVNFFGQVLLKGFDRAVTDFTADGPQQNPWVSTDKITIPANAYQNNFMKTFQSQFADPLIHEYSPTVVAKEPLDPTTVFKRVQPALNFCFDWAQKSFGAGNDVVSDPTNKIYAQYKHQKDNGRSLGYGDHKTLDLFNQIFNNTYHDNSPGTISFSSGHDDTLGDIGLGFNVLQPGTTGIRKGAFKINESKWFPFGDDLDYATNNGSIKTDGNTRNATDTGFGGLINCQMAANLYPSYSSALKLNVDAGTVYTDGQPADTTGLGSVSDNGQVHVDCSISINPLSWIMCPLISLSTTMINTLDGFINNQLNVPINYFDQSDPVNNPTGAAFYGAWSSMRSIALVLLVIIGLIMVLAQALSIGPLDPYTVKKVMPRLAIAVIGIALSWPLMRGAVALSNDLGNITRGIILGPFHGLKNPEVSGSTLTVLFGAGGLIVGTFTQLGTLSFLLTGALAVMVAFFVLIIRQIVIILLAMLAPLAIIAFVLPNTEKVWKLWIDSFAKALLMFPIIAAFIAAGRVFARASFTADPDFVHAIIAYIAYFAPYFLMPATFRLAGGALATIGGFVNDKSKGAFDGLKNFRNKQRELAKQRRHEGRTFLGGNQKNLRGKLNRGIRFGTLASKAGVRPKNWKGNILAAESARISTQSAEAEKNEAVQQVMMIDDLINAAKYDGTDAGARKYLSQVLGQSGRELEQNVRAIAQARAAVGDDAFMDLITAKNAGTGTGYKDGPHAMMEAIKETAGNDKARAARILARARGEAERAKRVDLYGAGFAKSADVLSQMYENPNLSSDEIDEMMTDEALKTKSVYEIGNARNNGFKHMKKAVKRRLAKAQYGMDVAAASLATARASGNATAIATAQQAFNDARTNHMRIAAATSGLLDVAGSASEENAEDVGEIMGSNVTVYDRNGQAQTMTFSNAIDGPGQLRNDPDYIRFRREYRTGPQADIAGRALPPDLPR